MTLQVGQQVVEGLGLGDDEGVLDEVVDRRVRALGHELAGQ